ncbi:hypothetical protein NE237_011951 [Protea cynaroides]|uniref:Uncharacterized protein n=1 Tax=Protea cynaroides TaxID=273540 RepID=A0A9Q0GWL8_9MAGN|nr:hypothetical protein NE237_011951 [Protea cynaroides]
MEPQLKQWEAQFSSGIQILEDLNLVISIQRKFNYLQSIPGVLGIPQTSVGGPICSNPPLLPFMSRIVPPHNAMGAPDRTLDNSSTIQRTVINDSSEMMVEAHLINLSEEEEKPRTLNLKPSWEDQEERTLRQTGKMV